MDCLLSELFLVLDMLLTFLCGKVVGVGEVFVQPYEGLLACK